MHTARWRTRVTAILGGRCGRCSAEAELDFVEPEPTWAKEKVLWSLVPLCPECRAWVGKRKTRAFRATTDIRTFVLLMAAQTYCNEELVCSRS